jgi:general secretion pathway protein K
MTPFKSSKRHGADRGFIVVAVLWILGALAALAAIYALYVKETAAAFSVHNDRLQGQALAQAGVELAVYQLTAIPESRPSRGQLLFRLGGANVSVKFSSENARIDLNAAPKDLLAGFFKSLGARPEEAAYFAERIALWRAAPGPGGGDEENSLYRVAGKPYGPRRGPFQHINELGLVLGLPPVLVERALPYLTVYSGQPEINVLNAPPEVLAAMPGLTPELLHEFLAQRAAAPQDVLRARLGGAARFVTVQASNATRMLVDVRLDGTRRHRAEVVVLLLNGDTEPYRVLSWRDEIDDPPANDRTRASAK